VFGGDIFSVSGNVLYRGETLLGTIDGTGPCSWAAAGTQLAITRGKSLWIYDGSTLAAVSFPDNADVRCVETLGGYFYAVRADTHRIYFSTVLDGSEWRARLYLGGEQARPCLRSFRVQRRELVALGSESVEFFQETGDADAPIALPMGTLGVGVKATGCTRL
jgi:hypothetical protein